ncbi:hypothetical protein D3C80_2107500 [compost metagenome]
MLAGGIKRRMAVLRPFQTDSRQRRRRQKARQHQRARRIQRSFALHPKGRITNRVGG